jgi:2-amino-4-hydroxy-6-hydroxymethyldihydropteridine diphosphokinase
VALDRETIHNLKDPMSIAAIGLGTNLGDRFANLQAALRRIKTIAHVVRVSKVYETAPMYVEDQPAFLNAAAFIETDLGPLPLLNALKAIEKEAGRESGLRYGPRIIDLDLVAYGALRYTFIETGVKKLILPHPRTPERLFVLQPLADLDPLLNLPGLGPVEALLEATELRSQSVQETTHALLPILRD